MIVQEESVVLPLLDQKYPDQIEVHFVVISLMSLKLKVLQKGQWELGDAEVVEGIDMRLAMFEEQCTQSPPRFQGVDRSQNFDGGTNEVGLEGRERVVDSLAAGLKNETLQVSAG